MTYKVFLVEDEVITREGIRDNVNWQRAGFSFCGEAPDGELALPQIQSLQPDLLITDIKMPFMDGLQLSRLVRASLPDVRIVILSGHDEFEYARAAISLGVSDYLLKPLGVRELEELLQRIGAQLDEERAEKARRQMLEAQVELDLSLRRDRFLLRLLTVGGSAAAVMEEARTLGYSLHSAYNVLLVRSEFASAASHDFGAQERFHDEVEALSAQIPSTGGAWLILRKDVDESVFVAMASSETEVCAMVSALREAILRHTQGKTQVRTQGGDHAPESEPLWGHTGTGAPQARLHQLNLSYAAALYDMHAAMRRELGSEISNGMGSEVGGEIGGEGGNAILIAPLLSQEDDSIIPDAANPGNGFKTVGSTLVRLHRAALADFLRSGLMQDFDGMFLRYMGATFGAVLDDQALQNPLVENYVRTDMALTIARFVIQMGAAPDQLFAELGRPAHPNAPASMESLRQQLRDACAWALDLRDYRATNRNAALVQRALHFMAQRYSEPSLSLGQVAAEVGLSPNHFSTVFSAETGETFRDHLSELRITRARELLRSTSMSNSEISDAVGYSDPHYFGAVFKRMMGQTPQQYRGQSVVAMQT